jgi:prephenate dehydratase/prephenate dehydrogenase
MEKINKTLKKKEKPIIAIIGGTGKMGSLFAKALAQKGYEVLISGRNTTLTPIEAAKKADILIVSVPMYITEKVIEEISKYMKKEALLTDFTSIKISPCKTMKENANCETIGGHPVFGPNVELKGQPFILCPINAKEETIRLYKDILESLGLNVIQMTPEEHDKKMAVIQAMNHFDNISFANALKELNFNISEKALFSPAFNLKMNIIERMLSQSPELYSDMEILNPYSKEYANNYLKALLEIKKDIDLKDSKALEKKIIELQDYFKISKKELILDSEKEKPIPKKIDDSEHKIAVLGPEFSYCHILAQKYFPKSEFILCNNIEEIFSLVSEKKVPLGISPIENMLNGSVREAIFSLKKYHVKINRLFNMPIHHCLASKSNEFKKIISHQQALAQCSKFLKLFKEKGYEIIETSSTSKAMEIASLDKDFAAIGSLLAAEHYKLGIINKNIEDNHNNTTSFILISKEENKRPEGKIRTSILVSPDKDKPGILYEILSAFRSNNINLTKIESIPTGNKIGEYIFYIEFDGSLLDENVKQAEDAIKSLYEFYSLGSYPIEHISE